MWTGLAWWAKGLVILAVCALVYWGVDHALGNVKQAGYTQAQHDDQVKLDAAAAQITGFKKQVADANDLANKTKQEADARVRAAEQRAALDQAAIQTQANRNLANEKATHDQFVGDLLAGRIRLRVDGQPGNAVAGANGGNQLPGTPAGAGGRDGSGTCELRPDTSAGLAGISGAATRLALKLNEARAIILADRKLCNGAPPAP